MQKLCLLIALLGLAFLIFYNNIYPPIHIESFEDAQNLLANQKVIVNSIVISQNTYSEYTSLKLRNNITLKIHNKFKENLINKSILAQGIIDTFQFPNVKVSYIKWK